MDGGLERMRDFYEHRPGAGIHQQEFWLADFTLGRWKAEGSLRGDEDLRSLFGLDEDAKLLLGGLGWTEAALHPAFEEEVLEDRGEHELILDRAGRKVLFFKGRRDGYMPEFVEHPVKDWRSWEEGIKWRLEPGAEGRFAGLDDLVARARAEADRGSIICQDLIGGCMFLRSLMGPVEWLYLLHDESELIHDCMRSWLALADRVCAEHQKYLSLDELFIAEDLCFKSGPLISPDMVREFFFPYYTELIARVKARQLDDRKLHIQVDTDGRAESVIELYLEMGMDYMSPFEVAAGSDVVAIRRRYPGLLMRGGFDKRILSEGMEAIDREVDRIMPFMKAEGGFIPSIDHAVPEETPFENYLHYRRRMLEFA